MGGLIAGLLAFGFGEAVYQTIPAESKEIPTMGQVVVAATAATQDVAESKNAALAFAGLGGALGLMLGIMGGLSRRSILLAATGGTAGLVLGAGIAGGATLVVVPIFFAARSAYPDAEFLLAMAMHGIVWGLGGAVAGLAFAIGIGRRDARSLVASALAGLMGAVTGTVAFDLIGAVAFPLAETGEPLSTTAASRLAARMLVGIAIGGALALGMPTPRTNESPIRSDVPASDPT